MNKSILIFTATYNEAENIENFLKQLEDLMLDFDILVIDDNSPDKTWEKIKNYALNKKNIKLIIRKDKEGLDTAHKLAFKYSRDNNYDYLVTLDADLTHDPKKIPEIINELESNYFVIGSRYMEGGKTDMKGVKLFLSYFGNKFIKFMFNIDCSEFTSSLRGFNLKKLDNFDLASVSSKGYSFFMETIFQINKQGIKIKQIPIYARQRDKGKSKIARIELLRTLLNVLRLKFRKN